MKLISKTSHKEFGSFVKATGSSSSNWQPRIGQFYVAEGKNNQVILLSSNLKKDHEFLIPGKINNYAWSNDGSQLYISMQESSLLNCYNVGSSLLTSVDIGLKDISYLSSSNDSRYVAVGTLKGHLGIIDTSTMVTNTIMGKHSSSIIVTEWCNNHIITCSDDNEIIISNKDGDSLSRIPMEKLISKIKIYPGCDSAVCLVGENEMLCLKISSPEDSRLIQFPEGYSNIIGFEWINESTLFVAFRSGIISLISGDISSFGNEIFGFEVRDKTQLLSISYSSGHLAVASKDVIFYCYRHDLKNGKDAFTAFDGISNIIDLDICPLGKYLTVCSKSGSLYVLSLEESGLKFATQGKSLGYICENGTFKFIQNQSQIDSVDNFVVTNDIRLNNIAIHQNRYMLNYNDSTFSIYSLTSGANQMAVIGKKSINSQIKEASLCSNLIGILSSNSELVLYQFGNTGIHENVGSLSNVKKFFLTDRFVVVLTLDGQVKYYRAIDMVILGHLEHNVPIMDISMNPRCEAIAVILDNMQNSFVYYSRNNFKIPLFECKSLSHVLWESSNTYKQTNFVVLAQKTGHLYHFERYGKMGPECNKLFSFGVLKDMTPLSVFNGNLIIYKKSYDIASVPILELEPASPSSHNISEESQLRKLLAMYFIGNEKALWKAKADIKSKQVWIQFLEKTFESLDLYTTEKILKNVIRDMSMLYTLDSIPHYGEKNLVAAYIASLLGQVENAQNLFLESATPIKAFELNRDLMNYNEALILAQRFAPDELSFVCYEYGKSLEHEGKYSEALNQYQNVLSSEKSSNCSSHPFWPKIKIESINSLIKMTFRIGDIFKGLKMVDNCQDQKLINNCGDILFEMSQFLEAASLYERAKNYNGAALCFVKAREMNKIQKIIEHVTDKKVLVLFASTQEDQNNFEMALKAYQIGNDIDNAVRIYIKKLNQPQTAANIVRKHRSKLSAILLSDFFKTVNDMKSAIEFLCIAGNLDEAMNLALDHDFIMYFVNLVQGQVSEETLLFAARTLISRNQLFDAGNVYKMIKRYEDAIDCYIKCRYIMGEQNQFIDRALECLTSCKNMSSIKRMVEYLLGHSDGVPKNIRYIFQLHISLKQYSEAAMAAILIAKDEQVSGNYHEAHHILLETTKLLKANRINVPNDIQNMLMLLHSYKLIKILTKYQENHFSFKMIERVCENISKFPAHTVPLLTSAVIQSLKIKNQKKAFEYASILMRPEYRNHIDPKHKRKFEALIRHHMDESNQHATIAESSEIKDDYESPCPHCEFKLPKYKLDCPECKNLLPYCIATGMHMAKDEWSECPKCHMPALFEQYKKLISSTSCCPMCDEKLKIENIVLKH